MRYSFKTLSGSTYTIDLEKMRWSRRSDHKLIGSEIEEGELSSIPRIIIGESAFLDMPDGTWVRTTPVTELLTVHD